MPPKSQLSKLRRGLSRSIEAQNRQRANNAREWLNADVRTTRERAEQAKLAVLAVAEQAKKEALRAHRNPARHREEAKQSQALSRAERAAKYERSREEQQVQRALAQSQSAAQQHVDVAQNLNSFIAATPVAEIDMDMGKDESDQNINSYAAQHQLIDDKLITRKRRPNEPSFNLVPPSIAPSVSTKRKPWTKVNARKKFKAEQNSDWLNTQLTNRLEYLRSQENAELGDMYNSFYLGKYDQSVLPQAREQYTSLIKDEEHPFYQDSSLIEKLGVSQKTTCVYCSRRNKRATKTENTYMEIHPIYSKVGWKGNTAKFQLKSICRTCGNTKSTILNKYFTGGKLIGGAIQFISQ